MSPILAQPATRRADRSSPSAPTRPREFVRQARTPVGGVAREPSAGRVPDRCSCPERNHFSVVADYADAQSALTRATLGAVLNRRHAGPARARRERRATAGAAGHGTSGSVTATSNRANAAILVSIWK